jgi:3-deoxy-manno-octulosonate cytidylyltransferase (CMP-KDO synthetase)
MEINTLGVIPARYASTRFPGKPLVMIEGKTMIQRVYEQALRSNVDKVIVATDDERIFSHVINFGGLAMMTSGTHRSGTERIGEVLLKLSNGLKEPKFDIVVNIQGDEPYIVPEQIDLLTDCFDDPETQIATLAKQINRNDDLFNVNVVKVLLNRKGYALYFSRSPVPYLRGIPQNEWHLHHAFYKHIGLYAYRLPVLEQLLNLEASPLEQAESLEQLRWLENSFKIKVKLTEFETVAIDTPEDLQKLTNKI